MASEQSSQIAQCIASGSAAPADESLALAVALFAFVGAGMWVFHRFSRRSSPPVTKRAGAPALAPAAS
ncbi:MAG TPA: hypothetical protein VGW11_01420 [Solirubrobacteraceae bacterium]|nr:hypothetical protein [Solirubrobacteraceae bacterium]